MAEGRDDVDLEAGLVRRAKAGDPEAYGTLVLMHREASFRVAYVLLGSPAEAEDAAQEAFVRAYLALDRFRTGEPFRPWLLRIVANEARNRRRGRGRREGLVERVAAVFGRSDAAAPPAEELVLAGERHAELRWALRSLREDERLVVVSRYLLELSEAETAAALGIPPGTVKSRLHRGLRRLRDRLGDERAVEAAP